MCEMFWNTKIQKLEFENSKLKMLTAANRKTEWKQSQLAQGTEKETT